MMGKVKISSECIDEEASATRPPQALHSLGRRIRQNPHSSQILGASESYPFLAVFFSHPLAPGCGGEKVRNNLRPGGVERTKVSSCSDD